MPTAAPERTEELERKIDALTEQVAFLAAEAREARLRRLRWEEFQEDAMPIAGHALEVMTRELDDLSRDVQITDLSDLVRRLIRVAPILDRMLGYLEAGSELVADMMPLTDHVMDVTTDSLVSLDQKGYFKFAKSGVHVVDRIVTGFSEEDVEQLGDNVVLILETIKEMTQPEIMAALHKMIGAVQRQQQQIAMEPEKPPSLFGLLGQLRDPEIRRGMGRALDTLRAVSEVDVSTPSPIPPTTSNEDNQNTSKAVGGN